MYLWLHRCQKSRISNIGSIATELSSEKALELQLTCQSYHEMTFSKFDSSLGLLVPNSRDRHEKQWRPDFTHHKTHPKIRFV